MTTSKILKAWIDGACRGNPGEAAIGGYIATDDGERLFEFSHRIGIATNNIAEYRALEYVVRWVGTLVEGGGIVSGLVIHSDSELLVKQMEGRYKVKSPHLKPVVGMVRTLIEHMAIPVKFVHVQRTDNHEADRLANLGF
ncbi:hypothetical protein AMJ86_03535 [bacterium SM23_57]|nr:MAG: hypothetical protein AMJ86_03535 [bacterium SM23_57]